MTIGAYASVPDFAYPGWRLTVPGGPAGGHYKGYTHNYSVGTDLLPADQYEQDREDGMSSHDAAYASPRNPRGVYRSPGEVPPRPNASGSAMTYRGYQTKRHAGTSIAPGAFPADFIETPEDAGIAGNGWGDGSDPTLHGVFLDGLGVIQYVPPAYSQGLTPEQLNLVRQRMYPIAAPAPVHTSAPAPPGSFVRVDGTAPVYQVQSDGVTLRWVPDPATFTQMGGNASSVVVIPSLAGYSVGSPLPQFITQPNTVSAPPVTPPQPTNTVSVPIVAPSSTSAAPSPSVYSNVVMPLNDGSGNFVSVATGAIIPGSQVTLNPLTQQYNAAPSAASAFSISGIEHWLTQPSSFFPSIPNWGLLLGAGVGAAMLLGHKGHR
jgi:hypothetical protein